MKLLFDQCSSTSFILAVVLLVVCWPVNFPTPAHADENPTPLDGFVPKSGDQKIINGEPVTNIRQFPWSVSIMKLTSDRSQANHICGGTLIGDGWVLTAAHCFDLDWKADPEFYAVGIGKYEYLQFARQKVKLIRRHSEYDSDLSNGNDVALIKLKSSTPSILACPRQSANEFGSDYCFAKLSEDMDLKNQDKIDFTITGFGETNKGSGTTIQLQSAKVPLLDLESCNAIDVYSNKVKDNMLCAGSNSGPAKADSCEGDSGGGLIRQADGALPIVAGIVSFGGNSMKDHVGSTKIQESCLLGNKFRIGVYSDVASHFDLLDKCINGSTCPMIRTH